MRSTITCDMEGVIETMNDGAEKIFGYKKKSLLGKKEFLCFHLVKLFFKMLEDGLKLLLRTVNTKVKHTF